MTGPELAAIRKRLGLTQTQLADALGYTSKYRAQFISRFERGVKPIPIMVALLVNKRRRSKSKRSF